MSNTTQPLSLKDSLTTQTTLHYANWALAKSSASFSRLNHTSARALIRCAFFVPAFWWALWERLRMRRFSYDGTANPATSATHLFSSKGGSSQTFIRGHTMSNSISRAYFDASYACDDVNALLNALIHNGQFSFLDDDHFERLLEQALSRLESILSDCEALEEQVEAFKNSHCLLQAAMRYGQRALDILSLLLIEDQAFHLEENTLALLLQRCAGFVKVQNQYLNQANKEYTQAYNGLSKNSTQEVASV